MPKRKEPPVYAPLGEKDHWHPYNLQMLTPTKFAGVVGKILDGRYCMIHDRASRSLDSNS
jgi:hypothetical protein